LVRNNAVDALKKLASQSDKLQPRRHAIWALGQLIRKGDLQLLNTLGDLLTQSNLDTESRAQVLKVLGDSVTNSQASKQFANTKVIKHITKLVMDKSPRVQFFAALALANIGGPEQIPSLLSLLDQNQDLDPMIRHAAVMGLAEIGKRHPKELLDYRNHASRYGRLGVLLALRRLQSPEIVHFLQDAEPHLVLEAARAINDVPMESADQSQLAGLINRPGLSDPLLRRVINANFRLGTRQAAESLAELAADSHLSDPIRLEAIGALQEWDNPSPIDRVTGRWRPLKPHSTEFLAAAIRPQLGGMFTGSDKIRAMSAKLAAKYGIQEVAPVLVKLVNDTSRDETSRVAALTALDQLRSNQLARAVENSLNADGPSLRAEARRLLAKQNPTKALEALKTAMETGETIERQSALSVLASMNKPEADAILSTWLERLIKKNVDPEIQLDILEAAKDRNTPELARLLKTYEVSLSPTDPLAAFQVALAGGNPQRGEEIFFGRSEVSCRRCHMIKGSGGEVGPDLSDIGLKKKRDYLLESIVDPNKQIAKGFESVLVATADGQVIHGVFKSEDETTLRLMNKDGGIVLIPKDEIDDRAVGKSGMPSDLVKYLTKSDVRDLVEYLSTLKTPPTKAKSEHKE
ncbi:MAG: HEAT repeat domain-containing protein, partial [Planctomycetaceae bacterium]|nr:HEAT repeat domain-containing protein [Planctomycetaceae bacterium]